MIKKITSDSSLLSKIISNQRQYSDKAVYENIESFEELSEIVAKLISQGNVIGWFQGRMEFGPRSLGNRSILVNACDKSVNNWLNKKLKRTEFMPFAPVCLDTGNYATNMRRVSRGNATRLAKDTRTSQTASGR